MHILDYSNLTVRTRPWTGYYCRWNPRNNPYNEAPPEEAKNKGSFRNYVDIKGGRGARGSVSRGVRDVMAPPLVGSSIVNENYRPGF